MCNSALRAEQRNSKEICLKSICFQAVREHFAALGTGAVLDLPKPVIEDLLPHLTVCQLDELQPALNHKGISTLSGWVGILLIICGPQHVMDVQTEEEAKHRVMRLLFTLVFYGYTNPFVKRNIANLKTPSFLWAAAKCMRQFTLFMGSPKPLQGLTAEQRPLLSLLEKHIKVVSVSQCTDVPNRKTQTPLYILHRLLDHGVAKDVVVHMPCPTMLAWLLHGRGSQYINPELKNLMNSKEAGCISHAASARADGDTGHGSCVTRMSDDDQATPCKLSKLDSVEEEESEKANLNVDPQFLCQMFTLCDGPPAGACPWGRINCLEIRQCGAVCLRVLNSSLPTFFSLRSLTLHSLSTFRDVVVLDLARALRQLSNSSHSSLTDLSISFLPYTELMEILLDASNITSLHVEVQTVTWRPRFSAHYLWTPTSVSSAVLPLKKLTIKVNELQTDLHVITSVLRRCPHLASLHIAGTRLPIGSSQSQLLTTLSESNRFIKSLTLEDMKLSDCLPEILNLLGDCKLEELKLNDCRLLESCSDKEECLQQLVSALKKVPSLHTLSLALNRLAKNVCVLAELFSGSSPSPVKRLNISSNFIQPAEMLEFAKRLRAHPPPHRLTLDLRKNPGDRDPDTWSAAMKELRPFCFLLVEGWTSTNAMADYISNM